MQKHPRLSPDTDRSTADNDRTPAVDPGATSPSATCASSTDCRRLRWPRLARTAALTTLAVVALLAVSLSPAAADPGESSEQPTSEETSGEQDSGDEPSKKDAAGDESTDGDKSDSDKSDGGATSDSATPSAEKLLREAGAIADSVARIRGLAPKGKIDKGIKTREELRKILVEKLAEEQSQEEMRQEAAVYRKLGLIAEDLDYREMILDVLTEQIAGFYDQQTGALNIMVGIPLDLQRPAMAHEIFHAIQDQQFDLTSMLEPFSARENGDFQLARSALIEGDATVLMIDFSLYEQETLPRKNIRSIVDIPMMANMLKQLDYQQLGALEKLGAEQRSAEQKASGDPAATPTELFDSALSEAPTIIRRVLIFPYLAGMRFVIAMRSGRTWEEFNQIYERPPVSTEQILHPEKYASRDEPVMLTYRPDAVLEDYSQIYDTSLGEFQMRLFLEHHLEPAGDEETAERAIDARKAAAGWDGDRLYAFENESGRLITTHMSVWDSSQDAVEYFNALKGVANRRFPKAETHTASGKYGSSICYRSEQEDSSERVYLERWGDAVLHIEGAPTSVDEKGNETDPTTYMLREQIWKTTNRESFQTVYERRLGEKKKGKESPEADDGNAKSK